MDELYLIDSGGQYFEGTTDVTRTMHFGSPTSFEIVKYSNNAIMSHICRKLCLTSNTSRCELHF